MRIHLIDGTYELFRHFFGAPPHINSKGQEVGAVRAVASSMLSMVNQGATHIGIATDHVVTSFRNELYDGYKDGSDLDPVILGQFNLLEEVLDSLGFMIFPMVDFEADDGLGAAARKAALNPDVEQVIICTPDKDLGQCLTQDEKIIQYDRRKELRITYETVIEKFGVAPESIPDYLGLVGDTADGFPGIKGWGAKSSATLLSHYHHIENIPNDHMEWAMQVRSSQKLSETLNTDYELALLFKLIATIDYEAPTFEKVSELKWNGPKDNYENILKSIDGDRILQRLDKMETN
ncbi:MAG: 5'-3' exonuclease H3TH domain-containing protein [Actinomycetota bacterium]|nr:flap endonuclease [Acidimicrobiaceae bacterium]MEC7116023.1 5'-3' exonuclease H3TH domain-containing protein [Actinomycetota bacterium]MEC7117575.1 5'-3' exonuclease H3TH domain-containing protein [Actinomycetota bacterium]MEC7607546.1 5'-3' exonuclease H3TH domain-containing protein [Actinomycetota bacterium]MEC8120115.1 5'-3' exonuclease H3TH domain-containing protein [Actinomycetota bacterium]|tara:strand:+ start:120 stop:995 length:876 start_codon:yes stop_codon:yes gene_type:complete